MYTEVEQDCMFFLAVWKTEWFSFMCWALEPGTVRDTESICGARKQHWGEWVPGRMKRDLGKSGHWGKQRRWWGGSGALFSSCVTDYRLFMEKHEKLFFSVDDDYFEYKHSMIMIIYSKIMLWGKKSLMFFIKLRLRKLSLFPSLPFCWVNNWRVISIKTNF